MKPFSYSRFVHFYETDLMGIVHHSNYLRFLEEARVAWLRELGLEKCHGPQANSLLAVIDSRVSYKKSLRFGDSVKVLLQVRKIGRIKLQFQYKVCLDSDEGDIATAETTHVCLDNNLKVRKVPELIAAQLEEESWIETWL